MDAAREIENLIYTYAELMDSGDLHGVAALFSHGEVVSNTYNTRAVGTEEVLAMYQAAARIYESTGTPLTKHVTSNVIIEVNGDSANTRSYFTVFQATEKLALQPIIAGRYHDHFTKRDEKWTFATREMFVDLMGDCSQHLLYELDEQ